MLGGEVGFRPLPGLFIAVALALPTAAAAQVQVNQNFLTQGPAPSFGLTDITQSRDAPPTDMSRRGRTRHRQPRGCEHALYRHAGGRILEDDERRNDLDLAHGQAGVALDFESYSQDGGSTWTSLGAGTLPKESVAGVAARGNVLVAGTYEISGFAT